MARVALAGENQPSPPEPWLGLGARRAAGAGAVAVVLVVAIVALIVRGCGAGPQAAAKLPALKPLDSGSRYLKGDVRLLRGQVITLTVGSTTRDITLDSSASIEALTPITPDTIAVGDYLTVGGIPNLVNSFAVKQVIVIPAAAAGGGSGVPRTKAGFTGWEAYTVSGDSPEIFGRVEEVAAGNVRLAGPTGQISVRLDASSPLLRLAPATVDAIRGGDHLAVSQGNPLAVLSLPGSLGSAPVPPPSQ
jgi:hypothetical protein